MTETPASATYAPLMEAYEREKLIDLIPMRQPLSLMVDPSSVCNFKCPFCPTGNDALIKMGRRKPVLLNPDLFKRIIEDINQFESPLAVLRLYKDGEPLLNPNFIDFVQMAKLSPNIKRVETTTNGSKLTKDLNLKLISAGIDRIVISVEGVSSQKYLKFAGVHINFDQFIETLTHLYRNRGKCQIHIKTVKENLGPGEDRSFQKMFGHIADRIFIENIVPSWPNFDVDGVNSKTILKVDAFNNPIVRKKVCPYLFYTLAVNADGIVSPCCVDWDKKLSLGNVANTSLLDVWNGATLRRLRYKHLSGRRTEYRSCQTCGQIDYCSTEYLDKDAGTILRRLGFDNDAK